MSFHTIYSKHVALNLLCLTHYKKPHNSKETPFGCSRTQYTNRHYASNTTYRQGSSWSGSQDAAVPRPTPRSNIRSCCLHSYVTLQPPCSNQHHIPHCTYSDGPTTIMLHTRWPLGTHHTARHPTTHMHINTTTHTDPHPSIHGHMLCTPVTRVHHTCM